MPLVIALEAVEKGDVETPTLQRGQPLVGILEAQIGAITDARAVEVVTGGSVPFLVHFEGDDRAAIGKRTRHMQRGDADRGAHLDGAARPGRRRQHLEQRAGDRDDDRDAFALAARLHLGQDRIGRRAGVKQIGLDCVADDHGSEGSAYGLRPPGRSGECRPREAG